MPYNGRVHSHGLDSEGGLWINADPQKLSWLDDKKSGPGARKGTAIITSHVNYSGVNGALYDLADWKVGQHCTVRLKDGRSQMYQVVRGASLVDNYHDGKSYRFSADRHNPAVVKVAKSSLDGNSAKAKRLRDMLFDQHDSWSLRGLPASSRIMLVTCDGAFDEATGNYLYNYAVFLLPTSADFETPSN